MKSTLRSKLSRMPFGTRFGNSLGKPFGRHLVPELVWMVVFLGAGLALCRLPLFAVLGYESSVCVSILSSVATVERGVSVALAPQRPPFGPLALVLWLWLRACVKTWLLCLVPLALLLLNGLRVRNCNYLAGLGFFALLPGLSAVMAGAVGVFSGLLVKKRSRALCAGFGVLLFSWLWAALRVCNSPAVFAYDPFFGYFPGALYDEEVQIETALYLSRLQQLCIAVCSLCLAAVLGPQPLPSHQTARVGLCGAVLLSVGCGLWWHGGRLGLYADEAAVSAHLSQQLDTPHFVLRYRPGGPVERDLQLYAREHELRYAQLHQLLGIEPNWRTPFWLRVLGFHSAIGENHGATPPKIVSYLFDSPADKRRSMGASHTYIAKPWRREIYIQHETWPHPVLRHELAHVFAGAAGDRVFRVSMAHGLPQMGLVEGLAVAADHRFTGNLSLHESVQTMQQAGLLPPLDQVFSGLHFWTLPSLRAYTVAGSFLRYLLEQHGPQKLLLTYQQGGRPEVFSRNYGQPFSMLQKQWLAYVAAHSVPTKAGEVEKEQLRRPAVFHKVCAHELAVRRQRAQTLLGAGREQEALSILQSICRDDPGEPSHALELSEAQLMAGRLEDAQNTLQTVLAHPLTTLALRGRVVSRLGDLAFLSDHLAQAQKLYEEAAFLPQNENQARNLFAKKQALTWPDIGPLLLGVLNGFPPNPRLLRKAGSVDALNIHALWRAAQKRPIEALPHYLLGRQLFLRGGYAEAIAELGECLRLGLQNPQFVYQARLLTGQAQLLLDDALAAERTFSQLLLSLGAEEHVKRAEITDFLERSKLWSTLPALTSRKSTR